MKPSISKSISVFAQEIMQRVIPLINDEYEKSRLNSWIAILILGSMNLDKAAEDLRIQNDLIKQWLFKYSDKIKKDDLKKEIDNFASLEEQDIRISSLDESNQNLRVVLVKAQTYFEQNLDREALKDCWKILRIMHQHRKVSHFIPLLKG